MRRLMCGVLLLSSATVLAAEPTAQAIAKKKIELMQSTQVAAVTELAVPSREYQSDGDPETLEVRT